MNPLRLLLAIYARLERPLLRFNYWLVRSPLVRWPVTRQLLWLGAFLPISYAGAAGQPMTADEAVELLQTAGEEGVIAVGPCGCRTVHRGCDHPTHTDFAVYEGVEAWSRAYPAQYQAVSLAKAEAIVRDCRSRGMMQVFYRTGPTAAPPAGPAPRSAPSGRGKRMGRWTPGIAMAAASAPTPARSKR
jgi:hypothetical protein